MNKFDADRAVEAEQVYYTEDMDYLNLETAFVAGARWQFYQDRVLIDKLTIELEITKERLTLDANRISCRPEVELYSSLSRPAGTFSLRTTSGEFL